MQTCIEELYPLLSCSNPFESNTILYRTIRIVELGIVQYKIVFDSKGSEQDMIYSISKDIVVTNLNFPCFHDSQNNKIVTTRPL